MHNKNRTRYHPNSTLLFTVLVIMIISCAVSALCAEPALKDMSFIPQWTPQAQFAGYYVAFEKGIYRKYGINLAIKTGGPYSAPVDLLEKGEVDFGTIWLSTAIQKRSQGIKIVNISQIVQRSSLMLVAKKGRGITRPEDINGKKVGLWRDEFRLQPMAFFKKYGLDVKIVPQSYSVNLFLRDGVDVASAMWYNEYHTIISAGVNPDELTSFFFHEYGLNFPEDGIYMLEQTFKKDPAAACNFAKASIEGWLYAFKHPEEALDIVLKYMATANAPANKIHQRWMLNRMKDLILPEDDKSITVGTLAMRDYQRVAGELKVNNLIGQAPEFGDFYKECAKYAEK
ncbi:MAG TPA: ABC transporter substrate-binding protein [Syntrophorhabdaceae bacterium]|nr:ABC transporter substrate-binding protein [Syntrophorhabdaceae bacterium]